MTRKPLQGTAGLIVSMTSFGLSKTFAGLVVRCSRNPYATKTVTDIPASRCIAGLLNGNMGVVKTMMGDLTDSTNRAQASGLIPLVWAVGGTIGCVTLGEQQVQFSLPLIVLLQAGGSLARTKGSPRCLEIGFGSSTRTSCHVCSLRHSAHRVSLPRDYY